MRRNQGAVRRHTTHTRDAALLQLRRANRWILAGSVLLTGLFAEAAARAFPGKSSTTTRSSDRGHGSSAAPATSSKAPLAPPAKAPSSGSQGSSGSSGSSGESSAGGESQQPAAPTPEGQAAPPEAQSSEAQRSEAQSSEAQQPAQQQAPHEEASGPVVSGGS